MLRGLRGPAPEPTRASWSLARMWRPSWTTRRWRRGPGWGLGRRSCTGKTAYSLDSNVYDQGVRISASSSSLATPGGAARAPSLRGRSRSVRGWASTGSTPRPGRPPCSSGDAVRWNSVYVQFYNRYEGSISQTNDGRLMVFPGTTLHMECLFMKVNEISFGSNEWIISLDVRHTIMDISQHDRQVTPPGYIDITFIL